MLHEKLYESKNLEKIEIRSYVDELIYFIRLSFSDQQKQVNIHCQIDTIDLDMDQALPFSLLLNELITNSYKHAFINRSSGNIYISFTKHDEQLTLHYRDDGVGFNFTESNKTNSLGMNLINAFSKQLKANILPADNAVGGAQFTLQFKMAKVKRKEYI